MEDYCEKVSGQGSDWPSVNVLLVWPPSCSRGKGGDAIKRTPFLFRGRGCAFQDTHTHSHMGTYENILANEHKNVNAHHLNKLYT